MIQLDQVLCRPGRSADVVYRDGGKIELMAANHHHPLSKLLQGGKHLFTVNHAPAENNSVGGLLSEEIDVLDNPVLIPVRIEKEDGISILVGHILNPPDDLRIVGVRDIRDDDPYGHRLFHQEALCQGIRPVVQYPDGLQDPLPGDGIDLVGAVVDNPGNRRDRDFRFQGNV